MMRLQHEIRHRSPSRRPEAAARKLMEIADSVEPVLHTLRDAANYITQLPKKEHDAPRWRAAIEALMLVAEHGGPLSAAAI